MLAHGLDWVRAPERDPYIFLAPAAPIRRGLLITGPQSAGNRLHFRLLCRFGFQCVIMRSQTHDRQWCDVADWLRRVDILAPSCLDMPAPALVIVTRATWPVSRSQRHREQCRDNLADALENQRKAYDTIFQTMPEGYPFVMSHYDELIRRPVDHLKALADMLDVEWWDEMAPGELIGDRNEKWYYPPTSSRE